MIKKLFLLIILFSFVSLSQDNAKLFKNAMLAFNAGLYSESLSIFDHFFKEYSVMDEMYSTAKFYQAEALLSLRKLDASAQGFEYIVRNFEWSAFRDKALYKAGLIYFNQVKYPDSRKNLKQLLDEYPESEFSGAALYWMGESYSRENNLEEAITFLTDAVQDKRNNKFLDYTLYTLASVYEKLEDYEGAVKYYDQLLSYHRESPLVSSARIRIGMCYFKLKDYQSSILELNNPQLSHISPDLYSESLYLLANSYYKVEEYINAEKTYKEIIQAYPGYQSINEVKYGLAWTYFQQKKYNDAYKTFNLLSDGLDSISIKSFYWKGESKRYAGQEQEAFSIYRDFIQKFPNHPLAATVQYQMGSIYFNSQRFDLAERYLNTAVNSNDNSIRARALTMLGEIYLNEKVYLTARDYFNEAMDVTNIPADLQNRSLLGLGAANYFIQDYKEVLTSLGEIELRDANFEKDKVKFYLAETYFAKGDYDKAISHYNQVNTDNGKLGSMSLYGKAYSFYNLQQYDQAADTFTEFIKKYSQDSRLTDARLRLADCYYGNKNYKAASEVYKTIFLGDRNIPDNPYAYFQYAQTLFKAGNTSDAVTEFRNLQQKFPNSEYADKSLYLIGWISFQQKRFSEAIINYNDVLLMYPATPLKPVILYSFGDSYYNMGKYDSALVNYQRVLNEFPSSNSVFDAINGSQYCFIALGKPEKAILLINDFVSRNPKSGFADQLIFKKGEIYYNIKDYEKAKTSYKEFVTMYPKSSLISDAYFWIGKSAQILGENDEAVQNFIKVFEGYPNKESAASSVIEISSIYNKQKKYDASLQVLNKASLKLVDSKRLPEIIFIKASTLANKGDISKAYEVYSELLQNFPGNVFTEKAKLEMGLIDLAIKRYESADLFFKNLSETRNDETGAKAQFYYGLSLVEQEKFNDAISALVRVKTVFSVYDEWVARSFLKLGDIYIELNDFNKAKEMYRSVIAKHKGDAYGQEAQNKLRGLK